MRYAFSLFSEFLALDCFEWTVYVRKGVNLPPEFYKPGINLKTINIRGSLVGRVAYEQLVLPIKVKNDRLELLFSRICEPIVGLVFKGSNGTRPLLQTLSPICSSTTAVILEDFYPIKYEGC